MTLRYDHLLGKPFVFEEQDCYTTLQDFYKDNFGIILPNYARPREFWKHGLNLYIDRYVQNGFEVLNCHPSEYREGDVFLMAISSTVANHAGILVENGQILHHLWGRLSAVEPYRAIYRNTTIGVFRHKDVVVETLETTTHVEDYLSNRLKKKLSEHS
jgi:cell wall-associated NlpC family hydrolase